MMSKIRYTPETYLEEINMLDSLYGSECEMSEISSDETVFYHLLSKEHLSYYIHKSLLNSKRLYKLIRDYNDSYHKNPNKKDYLSFCIVMTTFTDDSTKHYAYV